MYLSKEPFQKRKIAHYHYACGFEVHVYVITHIFIISFRFYFFKISQIERFDCVIDLLCLVYLNDGSVDTNLTCQTYMQHIRFLL